MKYLTLIAFALLLGCNDNEDSGSNANQVQQPAPTLAVVTVYVDIGAEGKEDRSYYNVNVSHQGNEVFSETFFGQRQEWENTTKNIASNNLTDQQLPVFGDYVLEVEIVGSDDAVAHQWWVEVEDDQGTKYVSSKGPTDAWSDDVEEGEYTVTVTRP